MINQLYGKTCSDERSPNANQSKWNEIAQAMFIRYKMACRINQHNSPRHSASVLNWTIWMIFIVNFITIVIIVKIKQKTLRRFPNLCKVHRVDGYLYFVGTALNRLTRKITATSASAIISNPGAPRSSAIP